MTKKHIELPPRPEMPRPFIPESEAAKRWQREFQDWVNLKSSLEDSEPGYFTGSLVYKTRR